MRKGFDGGGGQAGTGTRSILAKGGRPEWSWWWAISPDVARHDVTRFHPGKGPRQND
ncbi:MAG: hypothetical protein WD928_08500 [Gammaproteobacteria bacterium]